MVSHFGDKFFTLQLDDFWIEAYNACRFLEPTQPMACYMEEQMFVLAETLGSVA